MAQDKESWGDQAKGHGVVVKPNPKEEFELLCQSQKLSRRRLTFGAGWYWSQSSIFPSATGCWRLDAFQGAGTGTEYRQNPCEFSWRNIQGVVPAEEVGQVVAFPPVVGPRGTVLEA
ncbi:hypothetical protein FPOAC2_10950 [Fusarium poae]|jgi:hypothetical protein